jgi:hypothetical protein
LNEKLSSSDEAIIAKDICCLSGTSSLSMGVVSSLNDSHPPR